MAQQDGIQPSSITETLVANIGASAYAQPGSWGYPTQTTTDMNGAPIGDQMEIARNETVADNKPRLVILEQPKARGFRFRYDCEGQSHGGLPGENSERNRKAKSYPTVQLINYRGRARIVVSLVTESDPPLPHAHSIVGRNTENGQCTVEVGPENDMCATFPNLGILHVTRKKVVDVLTERFIQNKAMQITMQGGDPASQLGEVEREAARREADKVSKGMNLSVVRLCFQAYLPDDKGFFRHALEPVFGQKVYDSKAPSAANLKISRIDRPSGSVRGGDEVYLLCDKVQKNDIEVVFYEEGGIVKQEGDLKHWEALGSFGPQDVHHQYAIVFKTPPYYNMAIERPVTVMIVLRRPSDKEASDPKPFTYLPQEFDEERIGQKRRKKLDHYTNFFRGHGGPPGGAPPPPSGGDPGAGGMGDGGQGAGGQGGFFQGYYGGSGPAGPYAFTGYPPTQNPMDYQRQFNQGGGHMHGQPVSGDFPQGFDQAFSHQPGYDGGWGGGDLWGDPMGQPPSFDTHVGGYGYGANDPFAGSHGSLSIRDRGQVPPRPQDGRREGGGTKSVVDLEAEESGFAESNVPSLDQVTEQLHQQLMQSRSELARRQRQAMEVCERLLRALMEWARTRDTRYLLAAQQDIIAVQNSEGDTALHVAIINNHTDAVRALLDVLPQLPPTQTPVVDTQNHLNQASLHLAVLTKQTDVVDLLLKAHADKMARDRNGNTPLHLAAQQGSVEMVQVLLTSPQQQQPAVPGACTHPELIMLNMAGYTPMHLAVLCGNVQTMKLLHAAGADINAADSKSGRSPLHYASEKGELGLAGFLIVQRDICVDQPDYHGNTPLHLAAGSGHVELVKLLIQGGAQINLMNNERELPLDLARLKGHAKVIELMEQYLSQEQQREEEAIAHQMGSVSIVDQQSDPTTPRPAALHPVPTIKSEPSDLWMLSSMTRLKLAILLDPWREGQDWSALAERIGLGHLVPAFKAMSSPTKDLLSFYEDMSGTIDALVGHLQDMGRTDAVNLMQIAIKEYGGSDSASANSGPMLGNPFMLNPGTASGGPSPHSSLSLPMEERRQ